MNLVKHLYEPAKDPWYWSLGKITDLTELGKLSDTYCVHVSDMFTYNPDKLRDALSKALLIQKVVATTNHIVVAKDKSTDTILGYGWYTRGNYMDYSDDEYVNQNFIHISKDLPVRVRVKLAFQLVHLQLLWAQYCMVPVVIGTSLVDDQGGLMRVYRDIGFEVRGNYAYTRITS